MTDIGEHLKILGADINTRLAELMDIMCEPGPLKDAMSYSLLSGGKRLRPSLCMMTASMFGEAAYARDIACALEMIHAYSLIHDDLPAMDDDELRRGKPTSHVVFGQAYAILAGDGLLNCAFEVMLKSAQKYRGSGLNYLGAINVVAGASGTKGMVAGQAADIAFEGKKLKAEALHYIHLRKTAAMIRASVLSSAVLFKAHKREIKALAVYGRCLGLVFQIVDDILDEEGEQDMMGKTLGKDASADKLTFARAYGIEESRRIAQQKTKQAVASLDDFGERADSLKQLAEYLLHRDV